ncbi:MAG: cobalamin-dependent protein [Pirellulales bacterium]|nr:cobalamin-dependent protein [Pirellulales bacterium]
MASWAKRQGLAEPLIVQLPSDESGRRSFLQRLKRFDPHVVGFRLEGGGLDEIKRWIAAVRGCCHAEIVLGGPTPTSHPGEVLDECGADYVFAGEAEEAFARFLRVARQRNSKDRQPEISGLAYRYGGRTCVNTLPPDGYGRTVLDTQRLVCSNTLRCLRNGVRPVAPVEVIAANRLDWSLLTGFDGEMDGLYFTGGRGCPGSCTFCARLHGNDVRNKSAAQLLEEIADADAKVAEGTIKLSRWHLFQHVEDPALRKRRVAWAAIYDEDFFLDRRRAIEFFRLWDKGPLPQRYRISLQTNPCSMLAEGSAHDELLYWIDRVKPMVQLGAESFHDDLLLRWRKRHSVRELETVLTALDATRQDYTVFQLLSDFDTTPEELIESLRRMTLSALRHRRMRIASSPFTIPLYDSEVRKRLEFDGRLCRSQATHFTDYERPQPGWMDPLTSELADLADAELQYALQPEHRNGALLQAFEAVVDRIGRQRPSWRIRQLQDQASRALEQVKDAQFQGV